MSYTLNKIIDSIVYDNRYPTHQEIIDWAEQAKPFSEYEKIIEGMEEHNLCRVSYQVDNVYKRNFYPSTLNGATVIMETGNTLWSQNEKRKVDIKDLKGIEFSQIVAQRYSAEIAAKLFMKEEKRIKQEQDRIQREKAEHEREREWRAERELSAMIQMLQPKPSPPPFKPIERDMVKERELERKLKKQRDDIQKEKAELKRLELERELLRALPPLKMNTYQTSLSTRKLEEFDALPIVPLSTRKLEEFDALPIVPLSTRKLEEFDALPIVPLSTRKLKEFDALPIVPLSTRKLKEFDALPIVPLSTRKLEEFDALQIVPLSTRKLEEFDALQIDQKNQREVNSTPKVDTALLKPENTNKESSCIIL